MNDIKIIFFFLKILVLEIFVWFVSKLQVNMREEENVQIKREINFPSSHIADGKWGRWGGLGGGE